MKNPTPSSGGVFGEDGSTPVRSIGVLAGESADTDNTTDIGAEIAVLSDDDLEASIVEFKERIDALQAGLLLRIGGCVFHGAHGPDTCDDACCC